MTETDSEVSATLIFPSSTPAALAYYREAAATGIEIVAASSLPYDETAGEYETWIYLPTIYDEEFPSRLLELLIERGIRTIHCFSPAVHAFLTDLITKRSIDVSLTADSPIVGQVVEYRNLIERAETALRTVQEISSNASTLTRYDVAAILRQASLIYGETSDTKILAMMGVFATAPKGDVVEIGVLMGKSAFVLTYLAKRHGVGPVLTVDPWCVDGSVQHDSPEVVQRLPSVWPPESLADAFYINILPFSGQGFGHLRLPSAEALAHYSENRNVFTPEFGETAYTGRISVLHIDANHDYDCVNEDCRIWLPFLAPGGWLIIDDYRWLHGDGPRRVGDAVLKQESARVACAFVCGGALFVKLN